MQRRYIIWCSACLECPYATVLAENYFWRDASKLVEQVEDDVRKSTGQEPITIGMDKFSVASSLAFYDRDGGSANIRSQNLFGDEGVMYGLWFPSQLAISQPIILVGRNPYDLEHDRSGIALDKIFKQLGPIQHKEITRDGKLFRHVYYRGHRDILAFPRTWFSGIPSSLTLLNSCKVTSTFPSTKVGLTHSPLLNN